MPDDAYERLEAAAERITARSEYESANRRGLLWVHAIVGMVAGFQILMFGGPGNVERLIGVQVRPVLGGLAFTGGFLLGMGLAARPRNLTREMWGLLMLAAWDVCMVAGLLWARISAGRFAPLEWLEHQPATGYVVPYPIAVYTGYLALIGLHLWTLRRLRRASA